MSLTVAAEARLDTEAGSWGPPLSGFDVADAGAVASNGGSEGACFSLRDEERARDLLINLRALARELEAAIAAIASNNVSELETIVARQESLCAAIAPALTPRFTRLRSTKMRAGSGISCGWKKSEFLANEFNATLMSLQQMSQCYMAVISHSGRSVQMLATLCGGYRGQSYDGLRVRKNLSKEENARLDHPTWDCEI